MIVPKIPLPLSCIYQLKLKKSIDWNVFLFSSGSHLHSLGSLGSMRGLWPHYSSKKRTSMCSSWYRVFCTSVGLQLLVQFGRAGSLLPWLWRSEHLFSSLLNKLLSFTVSILITLCIHNFGLQSGLHGYHRVYEVPTVLHRDWPFLNLERCPGCSTETWKLILLNLKFYLNLLYSNDHSCYVPVDKTVSLDHGENTTIVCPKDGIYHTVIEIRSVFYGNESCPSNNGSKIAVMKRCQGRNQCYLEASTAIFNDSCPGIKKFLNVTYRCQSSKCNSD